MLQISCKSVQIFRNTWTMPCQMMSQVSKSVSWRLTCQLPGAAFYSSKNCVSLRHLLPWYVSRKTTKNLQDNSFHIYLLRGCHCSEFMGKTFQTAQLTHERFLTIDHSSNIFFDICQTELPRTSGYVTYNTTHYYYTPKVGGSSVWQISKKIAGVIYGQKSLMC